MAADVLAPLTRHYPGLSLTPSHQQILAEDWCDDLAGYNMHEIIVATKLARRLEPFFPVTAKMLVYCETARKQIEDEKTLNRKALPAETHMNDEQRRTAKEERAWVAELQRRKRRNDPDDTMLEADWNKFLARAQARMQDTVAEPGRL